MYKNGIIILVMMVSNALLAQVLPSDALATAETRKLFSNMHRLMKNDTW